MPLTDAACKTAKPQVGQYKMTDGAGLYLLVRPTGSKLWQMRYQFASKAKTLSFGPYPSVSLAEARGKREDAKRLLRDSVDPGAQKRENKIAATIAASTTFGAIAEEFLQRREEEGAAEVTLEKCRWLLRDLAGSTLAKRPIAQITPSDILLLLQRVERSGRLETARRLRSTLSRVFRLAIVTLRATTDPTVAVQGAIRPPVVTHRAAITKCEEFGRLLANIDSYDGWPTLTAALKFLALTFARPGEVRSAEWHEIDFKAKRWSIPKEKTKMRRDHDVPLSKAALAVLTDIRELTGQHSLVFQSIRSWSTPLSENAFNAALRRMGYSQDEHTAHGFRASASSILNEAGFRSDVIEAQLAHMDSSEVRRAYNRTLYWAERVELMDRWAEMCEEMKEL